MTATELAPFPAAGAGTPRLGEVIAWTCAGVAVRHADLVAALASAGLDEGVARELAPRHAFTRACKKLSDQRIIRPVGEDGTTVRFQFTAETRHTDRIEYTLETLLTLDKGTGAVTCDLPGLATLQFTGLNGGWPSFAVLFAGALAYAALAWLRTDRQYWHDAVCGTRLVVWQPPPRPTST